MAVKTAVRAFYRAACFIYLSKPLLQQQQDRHDDDGHLQYWIEAQIDCERQQGNGQPQVHCDLQRFVLSALYHIKKEDSQADSDVKRYHRGTPVREVEHNSPIGEPIQSG